MELIVFFVVIAVLYLVFCFFRAMFRTSDPQKKTPSVPAEDPNRRAEALQRFRDVHAAARDARTQVSRMVSDDPARAAKVLGKIMKH